MCHLRMVDNQAFTKWRMSSDLIINVSEFKGDVLRQCSDECQMDDFRRELCQLERMGHHGTLFAEMLGKLLHAFEQSVIQVLLPLNTVGDSFQQRNLTLYGMGIVTADILLAVLIGVVCRMERGIVTKVS